MSEAKYTPPLQIEPVFDAGRIGASLDAVQGMLPLRNDGLRGSVSGDVVSKRLGNGMEINGIRPYQIGDDVRKIDWKATARDADDELFVREHYSEVTPSVYVVTDMAANRYATGLPTLEYFTAQDLAFSAIAVSLQIAGRAQHPAGLVATNGRDIRRYNPGSGKKHHFNMMRGVVDLAGTDDAQSSKQSSVNLAAMLGYVSERVAHEDMVVVVSSFRDTAFADGPDGWKKAMRTLSKDKKNDVIGVEITVPTDTVLPDMSTTFGIDSGRAKWLGGNKTGYKRGRDVREQYAADAARQRQVIEDSLASAGVRHIRLSTHEPKWATSFVKQLG